MPPHPHLLRRFLSWRRAIATLLILAPTLLSLPSAAADAEKPNVLFIIVDDMNWRIGCYGNEIAHTPNLDRLAEHGVRFDRAYCNFPVCGASRTSFLSGRYPETTGVLNNGVDPRLMLGEDYRFLPEYFQDHGYYTVGVGKIPHTPEHLDSMEWDFHRDPQWQPEDFFGKIEDLKETRAWPDEQHPDGISARLAVEALETPRDKPLFLTVGLHRPHAPRAAPQKYWDMIDSDSLPIPEAGKLTEGIPQIAYPPKFEPENTEGKIRTTLQGYYSTAAFVDAQVGLLLDALDRNHRWENTVVVFFSDHGVHLGEHGGWWSKMSLMEEALKVPLLIHMPGASEGAATAEPAGLIDLFPTLTEICGLPPQEGVEGESLVPLLKDPTAEREKQEVFSIVRRGGPEDPLGYSVRTQRWAYCEWPDGSKQLYHHLQDPGELHNLAGNPEHQQIEDRLANLLEKHRARHPLRQPGAEPAISTEVSRDRADYPDIYRKGGGFKPDKVLTYKTVGDRELKLDVFLPEDWAATDSRPAAVFYFGGGWKNGDTRQFYPQSEYLASRGMVAISAEYRTENNGGAKPFECVEDAKSAMRYVRAHAAELGIDPDKLAAGGASAGGHLAAATATIEAFNAEGDDLSVSPIPNALLLYNPACDNSAEGYGFDRVQEYWQDFSPMEHLDGVVPPTIIFLGDQDGVFPVPRAKLYQQRMQESGNRCDLLLYEDQDHGFYVLSRVKQGFDAEQNKKYFLETTESLDRFLASLGFLSGEPTAREWFAKQEPRSPKAPSRAHNEGKPNVVVILADDLGYQDLSVLGSPDAITPNLDGLAENGIRCTQAYISAPVCSPSRAGLLTGRYQNRFGFEFLAAPEVILAPGKQVGIDPGEQTIADRMKALGYYTGCIGKWHVGSEEAYLPTNRGFDEFYGSLGQSNYFHPTIVDSRAGSTEMIETADYYLTDDYSRRAVEFIHEHHEIPFFLYLPHFAVHKPYEASDQYLERFPNAEDPRRQSYLAMLSAMDDAVGAVLTALKEKGLEENSLIFFLSDNGGTQAGNNDPLRGSKGATWEGGIRTPFLVQWKARLPQGVTYENPIISLDILPTAVMAAGGQIDEAWDLDGVNLLPYLEGQKKGQPHEALYWKFGTQWAVRMGDWKALQAREERGGSIQIAKEGPPRLYHLSEDISEEWDLAQERPNHLQKLQGMWQAWAAELPEPHWLPTPVDGEE